MKKLIEMGADINATNLANDSALIIAASKGIVNELAFDFDVLYYHIYINMMTCCAMSNVVLNFRLSKNC